MSQDEQQIQKNLLSKISELESEIKKLKERKKYGLVWDDKPEDVVLQCRENVPILKETKSRRVTDGNTGPTNLLIEGDNYHALSVLNYTHRESFDVVYADPPYNTGNKSWRYNNDYIEKDDDFKHSKWLSYIYKRLLLAKNLLSNSGILVFAIDDYEAHTLRLLLDEVMGEDNRLGTVAVIHNPGGRQDEQFFATAHEYMLVYAKDRSKADIGHLNMSETKIKDYKFSDEASRYKLREYRRSGANSRRSDRKNLWYPIYINPRTLEASTTHHNGWDEVLPIDKEGVERVWRWNARSFEEKKERYIFIKRLADGYRLQVKERQADYKGEKPKTFWFKPEYSAVNGTAVLKEIFSETTEKIFDFPKSPHLMRDILSISSSKDAMILDFFAGSGTTGHAVLDLNKEDSGNRRFVLCTNNENNICEEVTYERLKRVMKGYQNKKQEKVDGLGGNLSYYKTDLVNIEKLHRVSDDAKIKITYQAGEMIAIRENTPTEVEKNDWWQIFEGDGRLTAIYFKEDKMKLAEIVSKLEKMECPVVLYVFSWGKNEYKNEFGAKHVRIEDIPDPILEVYKEINRI